MKRIKMERKEESRIRTGDGEEDELTRLRGMEL